MFTPAIYQLFRRDCQVLAVRATPTPLPKAFNNDSDVIEAGTYYVVKADIEEKFKTIFSIDTTRFSCDGTPIVYENITGTKHPWCLERIACTPPGSIIDIEEIKKRTKRNKNKGKSTNDNTSSHDNDSRGLTDTSSSVSCHDLDSICGSYLVTSTSQLIRAAHIADSSTPLPIPPRADYSPAYFHQLQRHHSLYNAETRQTTTHQEFSSTPYQPRHSVEQHRPHPSGLQWSQPLDYPHHHRWYSMASSGQRSPEQETAFLQSPQRPFSMENPSMGHSIANQSTELLQLRSTPLPLTSRVGSRPPPVPKRPKVTAPPQFVPSYPPDQHLVSLSSTSTSSASSASMFQVRPPPILAQLYSNQSFFSPPSSPSSWPGNEELTVFRARSTQFRRMSLILEKAEQIFEQQFRLQESNPSLYLFSPRLFVILPTSLTTTSTTTTSPFPSILDSTAAVSNQSRMMIEDEFQFKIHFLCECGQNYESFPLGCPPCHVNLEMHSGYLIDKPKKFFDKFGPYLLVMLETLRLGVDVGGYHFAPIVSSENVVNDLEAQQQPHHQQLQLKLLQGIEQSIEYLENHWKRSSKSNFQTGNGFGSDESRTDFQNLKQYLDRVSDIITPDLASSVNNHLLGREIYRHGGLTKTRELINHFKWECFDHAHIV